MYGPYERHLSVPALGSCLSLLYLTCHTLTLALTNVL